MRVSQIKNYFYQLQKSNLIHKITLTKETLPYWLALLAFSWTIFLYLSGRCISGPFIFGDEATYFSFSRDIFQGKNIAPYTQYGPLYPALISPLFFIDNIVKTYQVMRVFNIILFVSAIIPAYFLAKEIFTNKWLQGLLPACVLFSSFGGYVYLIWAEPLYIALFYWTCFLLFKHTKDPGVTNSLLLGALLSSLYYTKPGAGLVVQMAAFSTLAIYAFITCNSQSGKKKIKLFAGMVILICLVLDLPWILHYRHLGVSIIGYPQATTEFSTSLAKTGYLALAFTLFRSIFYQFSYFFIGSWGMIGICMALFVVKWRQLKDTERNIIFFILSCMFGLIALSALGMSTHRQLDYRMPNGRYFSVLLPIIIALTIHLLLKEGLVKKADRQTLLVVIFVTTMIAIVASPLYTRNPVAFTSMSELSLIIYITSHGQVLWGPLIEAPTLFLRLAVALFFGGVALCALLPRKWLCAPLSVATFVLIGFILSGLAEHRYMVQLGKSQSRLNNIYIYFLNHHINTMDIIFDKKMELGNPQFMTIFWLDKPSAYQTVDDISKENVSNKARYFVSSAKLAKPKVFISEAEYAIYNIEKENP